jgi:hypothetical protein
VVNHLLPARVRVRRRTQLLSAANQAATRMSRARVELEQAEAAYVAAHNAVTAYDEAQARNLTERVEADRKAASVFERFGADLTT